MRNDPLVNGNLYVGYMKLILYHSLLTNKKVTFAQLRRKGVWG